MSGADAPTDGGTRGRKRLEQMVKLVLIGLLAVSLLGVAYIAIDPPQSTDPYSEFYLLGAEGNASDYPTELEPGERGTVTVGVINHEGETVTYRVRVVDMNATSDGILASASQTVPPEETWETDVTFTIDEPGRHRVQFQLYKGEIQGDPYLTTRLWVNVTETDEGATGTPTPTPTFGTGTASLGETVA